MKAGFSIAVLCALAALGTGCASYSGAGLTPGSSTAADVERVMGRPKEKVALANGDSTWFYPHNPAGRDTYAVIVAPDGKVRSIDQRLTEHNIAKLVAGTTTAKEVREIFGPPSRAFRTSRSQLDAWEYFYYNPVQIPFILYVNTSSDGIVREVVTIRDPSQDFPGGYN